MSKPDFQSLIRRLLTVAFGYIGIDAAKHDQLLNAIVSAVILVAVQAWSEYQRKVEPKDKP